MSSLLKYAGFLRGVPHLAKGISKTMPKAHKFNTMELNKLIQPKIQNIQVGNTPQNLFKNYQNGSLTFNDFAKQMAAFKKLTKQSASWKKGLVGLFNPLRNHVDGKHPKSKIPSYADKLKQNQRFKRRMTPAPAAPAPAAPAPDPVKDRFKARAMQSAQDAALKI